LVDEGELILFQVKKKVTTLKKKSTGSHPRVKNLECKRIRMGDSPKENGVRLEGADDR